MPDALERLKILINSSTPIVVMETVEETRAVRLVRAACAELNMAVFEWSIADGLVRYGSNVPAIPGADLQMRINAARHAANPDAPESSKSAVYNTADPVQALANLESMTLEAVFILKDFHRHMDSPVIVRRLRDVGQKFSANRRTLILTTPSIAMPPELTGLIEYLDLPLPRRERLLQYRRDIQQAGKDKDLRSETYAGCVRSGRGSQQPAWSDRGRSGESGFSSPRSPLCALSGDNHRCARSQERIAASLRHAGVHRCFRQHVQCGWSGQSETLAGATPRRLGRISPGIRIGAAARNDCSRHPGLRQEPVCQSCGWRVEDSPGEIRQCCHLRQVHRRNRETH